MTASLYHWPSAMSAAAAGCGACASLGLGSPLYTEDMRGKGVRVQLDVVAAAVPGIAPAGELVVQLVALARRAEIDPARMYVMRVEVNYREDEVVSRLLGVGDHLAVVDAVEAQAPVRLQRRIVLPHLVQLGDQLPQAVRPLALPALHLVLLRVEILLAARVARGALAQLERRPVDAVARGERAGQHQAHDERRPAAVLQVLVQDVG